MVWKGTLSDIPVTIDGVRVGLATITTDGKCEITFIEHAKQYADLIAELLATGHANTISVEIGTDNRPEFWDPRKPSS